MRTRILFLLLLSMLFGKLKAQITTIGECEGNNQYLPSYSYYNYTLSQQIYTVNEIGGTGIISSIAFYNNGSTQTRTYNIYMVNTEKSEFTDSNDWIVATLDDLVFSGSVIMTAGDWTTIEFDDEFEFEGPNLAVIIDDNTGSWSSSMNCCVFSAESNQGICVYSDGTNYDPFSPLDYYGTLYNVKNQIQLDINYGGTIMCKKPKQFHSQSTTTNSAVLEWIARNDETSWQFVYSTNADFDPNTITPITVTENPFTLTDLQTDITYYAYIRANCENGDVSPWSNICVFCPTENCIDLSDLTASNIHCTYGSFWDPYQYSGIINGRHTVINQHGLDPHSCGGLEMIPPGGNYSIRLGNDNTGSEAESISCDILVDTTDFDLLILKYAAVMQDPSHGSTEQPRFTFDILDTQNNPIDPNCLSADFIASSALGWNYCDNNGTIWWKDWTNVGVDISSYHGETIRVRLTTYDCSQGAHYGYAYFLLGCGHKHISVDICGAASEYSYSAPSGFEYNWFWQDDPSNTISTNQAITVPAGANRILQCHVSFIGNPDCGFDLTTSTEYRFPLSGFSIQNTGCQRDFNFINESAISNDGIIPDGSGELCEDAYWDFGDGTFSNETSPSHSYDLPGNYNVMMVAGLCGFACTDTTYQSINVPENMFDVLACDSLVVDGIIYTENGVYTQHITTSQGCDSLVTINLTIANSVTNNIVDTVCDNFVWNGETYNTTGVYEYIGQTVHGCDSIVTLNLTVNYSDTTYLDTIVCDSYTWYDSTYVETGIYSYVAQNVDGCDSLLVLNLTVGYAAATDTTAVVCNSFDWYGITYTETGDYEYQGQTTLGCDSIVTLHLTVNYSDTTVLEVAACDGYEWYGDTLTETGVYEWMGQTVEGCDSIVMLQLTVNHSDTTYLDIIACEEYEWYDTTYLESGIYSYLEQTVDGCDSLLVLNLTVGHAATSDTTLTVCDWYDWNGVTYTATGDYDYQTQTVLGCDSVATLHLTVNYSDTTYLEPVTACEAYEWYGETYTETGVYAHMLSNAMGCDSVLLLNVTVDYEHYQEDVVAVCYSYEWRGETYTESGEYTDVGPNPMGCDTTFVLRLTIGQDETGDTTAFVCDGFQWYEHYCTSTGQYEHMFQTVIGCDSLVTLDLTYAESFTTAYDTVVCDRYPWPSAPNGFLTETGHYLYEGYTSEGCDSIVDMELTVNYTPDLLIDGLSQVAMTTHYGPFYVYYLADSAELSTCAIDWQCSNPDWVMILGSNPYECRIAPVTLGQATLTATTHCLTTCDTTYVFEINASHYGVGDNGEDEILLFPNPADDQVTIQAPQINHVRMLNSYGQVVKDQAYDEVETTTLEVGNLAQGIYIVEITTTRGKMLKKLIIQK